MSGSFQTSVRVQPAPALAGDFASANPRSSVLAGPGSLYSGANGVAIGVFAWAVSSGVANGLSGETDALNIVSNAGSGVPTGFVSRKGQFALITTYLAAYGGVIPPGKEMTLHTAGDFWVNSSTVAAFGQKIFANLTTGAISTAAAGATVTGSIETKWYCWSAGNTAGDLIKMSTSAPG